MSELHAPFIPRGLPYTRGRISSQSSYTFELPRDGILAVKVDEEYFSVHFILFEFESGRIPGPTPEDTFTPLVHGWGFAGNLRELRHSFWGDENGYISTPNPDILMQSFEHLRRWFDYS